MKRVPLGEEGLAVVERVAQSGETTLVGPLAAGADDRDANVGDATLSLDRLFDFRPTATGHLAQHQRHIGQAIDWHMSLLEAHAGRLEVVPGLVRVYASLFLSLLGQPQVNLLLRTTRRALGCPSRWPDGLAADLVADEAGTIHGHVFYETLDLQIEVGERRRNS